MPLIGAAADDMTGASTTGALLARSGARTAVFLESGGLDAAANMDAAIISTDSRALPPESAYKKAAEAARALEALGVRYFSKRIDTTLRGGVGTETDAMLDVLGEDCVAVAVPAMPQSRRVMVGGYSLIEGVPLSLTPVAQDVRTPVRESCVPRLLAAQTRRKVGLVELGDVLAGAERTAAALSRRRAEGCGVIAVDAVSSADVDVIAGACVALGWNVLCVDPGPFTAARARALGLIGQERSRLPEGEARAEGTAIAVVGSATPVTERQIARLIEWGGERFSVDPVKLADCDGAEEARAIDAACLCLERPAPPKAVVLETALHGVRLSLEAEDARRGLAPGGCALRINEAMGRIAAGILARSGGRVAGLYCTGGDTEAAVCRALRSPCLELLDYVIPQSDVARLTGKYAGLPIIGKGGLTGGEDIAIRIVERLFKEASREENGGK